MVLRMNGCSSPVPKGKVRLLHGTGEVMTRCVDGNATPSVPWTRTELLPGPKVRCCDGVKDVGEAIICSGGISFSKGVTQGNSPPAL